MQISQPPSEILGWHLEGPVLHGVRREKHWPGRAGGGGCSNSSLFCRLPPSCQGPVSPQGGYHIPDLLLCRAFLSTRVLSSCSPQGQGPRETPWMQASTRTSTDMSPGRAGLSPSLAGKFSTVMPCASPHEAVKRQTLSMHPSGVILFLV